MGIGGHSLSPQVMDGRPCARPETKISEAKKMMFYFSHKSNQNKIGSLNLFINFCSFLGEESQIQTWKYCFNMKSQNIWVWEYEN